MNDYVADFETTLNEEDCHVWCFSITKISSADDCYVGNDIDEFFDYIKKLGNVTIYFHNLRFDGQFIIYYLLAHKYTHTTERKLVKNTFTTLISGLGIFYSITVKFENGNIIHFYDSLKKIPLKVKELPKAFGLEEAKGEIDYKKERPNGYIISKEEEEYVKNDTIIVAKSLEHQINEGLTKMTIGSDALNNLKSLIPFSDYFPVLDNDIDDYIRKSYRGGWTYLNPKFANKDIGKMCVYDVNSLYPSRMRYCLLPYGMPIYFKDKYIKDEKYPLYIAHIRACFTLKENGLPCVQDKSLRFFSPTEYIREYLNINEPLDLYLTSVDLKLFMDMYDIIYIDYIDGYKFQARYDMFNEYIDKWNNVKMEASKSGNKGLRTIAKLLLNNIYGKLATSTKTTRKIPYLKEDGIVGYKTEDDEIRKPVYTACASFITAHARDLTIRSATSCLDLFIYADTDSLHIFDIGKKPNIAIDDVKLGYFKLESTPVRGRFLRAKTYIEEIYDEKTKSYVLDVKCAGMNEDIKKLVTFDNFHYGFESNLKKHPKLVKGGVILEDIPFTITTPKCYNKNVKDVFK